MRLHKWNQVCRDCGETKNLYHDCPEFMGWKIPMEEILKIIEKEDRDIENRFKVEWEKNREEMRKYLLV